MRRRVGSERVRVEVGENFANPQVDGIKCVECFLLVHVLEDHGRIDHLLLHFHVGLAGRIAAGQLVIIGISPDTGIVAREDPVLDAVDLLTKQEQFRSSVVVRTLRPTARHSPPQLLRGRFVLKVPSLGVRLVEDGLDIGASSNGVGTIWVNTVVEGLLSANEEI